jgi:hypothetical protein
MGITVVLVDERGRKLASIEDPTNVLHRLLPGDHQALTTQMLRYIDWYGDTMFNHLQAERFLEEWDTLASTASTGEDQRVFTGIRDLAERLRSEHHVYLKFYGD